MTAASALATLSTRIFEWHVVGSPATSMMSLIADRHAVQRASAASGGDLGVGLAPRLQRGLRVQADERVQLRVERLDPCQQIADQLRRGVSVLAA